jgi:hypothetical protein
MDAGLDETRMKMLGELAEMALVLARDLQQAALVAETAEEKVRLADAFHKVGRGVRQSLALHARLERDAQLAGAPAQAAAPAEADRTRREGRAARLRSTVERLIWTEREKLDAEPYVLRIRLQQLIAGESRAEDFLETDPDLQIARLCETLGVPIAPSPLAGEGGLRSRSDEGSGTLATGPP